MKRRVIVNVSIDTEEDQWGPAGRITLKNLRALPAAADRLARIGVRPTWYTAWTVANDPESAAAVAQIHRDGTGEIGAHVHPWNTPPDANPTPRPWETMLCNLPESVQQRKIETLTARLTELREGQPPLSFRAGRWGLGPGTVRALVRCGYQTDSSVMPFVTWAGEKAVGPNFIGAPWKPYWLGGTDVRRPVKRSAIVELPASVGFTRRGHALWRPLQRLTHRRRLGRSTASNMLWRAGVLRKAILTPEMHGPELMLKVARALVNDGAEYLHLFWHSQSMTPGLGPFGDEAGDGEQIFETLSRFVDGLGAFADPEFLTVGEAGTAIRTTLLHA